MWEGQKLGGGDKYWAYLWVWISHELEKDKHASWLEPTLVRWLDLSVDVICRLLSLAPPQRTTDQHVQPKPTLERPETPSPASSKDSRSPHTQKYLGKVEGMGAHFWKRKKAPIWSLNLKCTTFTKKLYFKAGKTELRNSIYFHGGKTFLFAYNEAHL